MASPQPPPSSPPGTERPSRPAAAGSPAGEAFEAWWPAAERLPLPVAVLDEELRVVAANAAWPPGAPPGPGGEALPFVDAAERAGVRRACEGVLAGGPGAALTFRAPGPHGAWMRACVARVAARGKPALLLAAMDVTPLREAEQAARAGEAGWRRLVESAPDTIAIVGRDLRLQFVNRLPPGLAWEAVRGLPVLGQAPEEYRAALREHYRRVFEEHATVSYDLPCPGPDGRGLAWWHARMAPVLEGGEAVAAVVFATDVTRAKRNGDPTREREALLGEAERVARMGSYAMDMATLKVQWSEGLQRVFGVEGQDFDRTLQGFLDRVHPEDRERMRDGVLALRAGDESEREFRIVRGDGEVRIVHSRSKVLGEPGEARLVGVAQDVTDLRRAEQERATGEARARELQRLKELDAFKTQFINTAAHELGTPLTPIRLQIDLLQSRPLDERQRRSLAIVSRNVDRLAQLVQDVLEVARLQAGRLPVDLRPLDLAPLLADAVESFQEPARQGGLALELRAPPGLRVAGDPRRLTQVLYNLLSNALKFTPRGGRIVVEAERDGAEVRVTVRDTGIGIKGSDLGKLFEPFSQVHDVDDKAPPGTGLGLFISKGIIELHGGRIAAESDGPGRGAAFTVTLPAAGRLHEQQGCL